MGTILVGMFAERGVGDINGLIYGGGGNLLACQLFGIIITTLWSGVMTWILVKLMLRYCAVDVSVIVEEEGLDISQIGEQAYDDKLPLSVDVVATTREPCWQIAPVAVSDVPALSYPSPTTTLPLSIIVHNPFVIMKDY